KLLPEPAQRLLFTEVAKGGGSEMQTPAIVRYLISQFPLVEGVGKAAHSITRPEDAANPHNWMSPTLGIRVTERTPQEVNQDKRRSRRERATSIRKLQRQRPKKAQIKSLYERYQQEP